MVREKQDRESYRITQTFEGEKQLKLKVIIKMELKRIERFL